jgi:hypothetical protein
MVALNRTDRMLRRVVVHSSRAVVSRIAARRTGSRYTHTSHIGLGFGLVSSHAHTRKACVPASAVWLSACVCEQLCWVGTDAGLQRGTCCVLRLASHIVLWPGV